MKRIDTGFRFVTLIVRFRFSADMRFIDALRSVPTDVHAYDGASALVEKRSKYLEQFWKVLSVDLSQMDMTPLLGTMARSKTSAHRIDLRSLDDEKHVLL